MVSGSKLKNPSKVSGESPISLYYSLIYGNCLGNVVMGMEKCGKMCENVWKCAGSPFSIYYSGTWNACKFFRKTKNLDLWVIQSKAIAYLYGCEMYERIEMIIEIRRI